MATGRYFTQTDFRQFDLNFPWAERTAVELQTTGLILLDSEEYDAVYRVNYNLPGTPRGEFSLYGANFSKNASNHLTGGSVQAMVADFMNGSVEIRQSRIEGLTVSAVTVHAAMRTADTDDDQLVLRAMFRGSDNITFSPLNDYGYGFGGDDTLCGEGGNDRMFGQSGNDAIRDASGDDFLSGGYGSDRLFGGADNDTLRGNNGADFLKGGSGDDRFDFNPGDDRDTINDWEDGDDQIRIYGDVGTITITASGDRDVRISALNLQIVVQSAQVGDFQQINGDDYVTLF